VRSIDQNASFCAENLVSYPFYLSGYLLAIIQQAQQEIDSSLKALTRTLQ